MTNDRALLIVRYTILALTARGCAGYTATELATALDGRLDYPATIAEIRAVTHLLAITGEIRHHSTDRFFIEPKQETLF